MARSEKYQNMIEVAKTYIGKEINTEMGRFLVKGLGQNKKGNVFVTLISIPETLNSTFWTPSLTEFMKELKAHN